MPPTQYRLKPLPTQTIFNPALNHRTLTDFGAGPSPTHLAASLGIFNLHGNMANMACSGGTSIHVILIITEWSTSLSMTCSSTRSPASTTTDLSASPTPAPAPKLTQSLPHLKASAQPSPPTAHVSQVRPVSWDPTLCDHPVSRTMKSSHCAQLANSHNGSVHCCPTGANP